MYQNDLIRHSINNLSTGLLQFSDYLIPQQSNHNANHLKPGYLNAALHTSSNKPITTGLLGFGSDEPAPVIVDAPKGFFSRALDNIYKVLF